MNSKQCTKCGQVKFLTEFHKVTQNSEQRRSICKLCHNEIYRNNYKKNPEKYRQYTNSRPYRPELKRKANLKTFGLTIQQYEEMLQLQQGVCAICAETCTSGKRLAVDHCHVTGRVRQLLCRRCNQSIGKFNDDPVLLQKAVDYLLKWQTSN
jgi:hypothetical protein